jgi:hypothetical protein
MGEACSTHDLRNAYKILVGKPEGKTTFRRPSSEWDDDMRMYLRETGPKGVDWLHMTQDRED